MIYYFWSHFTASNNFRLAALWITALTLLCFKLLVLGSNPAPVKSSHTELQQRFYNEYFHNQFATDRELNPPPSGFIAWLRSVISRKTLIALFVITLIYTVVALREEVGRAWQHARERTQAWRDVQDKLPPPAPTAGAGGATTTAKDRTFHQVWIFMREFAASIIAELLGERAMR